MLSPKFHFLERGRVRSEHRKNTLRVQAPEQTDGEPSISLKYQVRKKYRWQSKYTFTSQEKRLCSNKSCYPSDINVTETHAEIKLQSLVDHTITRLCKVQDVLKTITDMRSIDIFVKWGSDGAEQNK
ncbi:hypothetical protein PR048_023816 [Dryococelus australis]|uniref:Uncharacterized protein n=1 Tax=Dryococelus australis TaxID=614101 RepID=A0ABQ9GV76_9NEOP|nr:hypothetical protein PR048_023816 [Dryococelus australis]